MIVDITGTTYASVTTNAISLRFINSSLIIEQVVCILFVSIKPRSLAVLNTTSLFFVISSFLVMIGFYCSALYMSEHRDIRRIIKNDIRKYDLLTQMSNKFIEDETINYINHFKKSSKSELFVNYPGLFLNDEDIKQYVKNVINEISKKDNNNTDNKEE